jgi:hypothetical protein
VELTPFVTRVQRVQAVQVTRENIAELALLVGAELGWGRTFDEAFLLLETEMGKTNVRPGMWMVKNEKGWLAMRDDTFRKKYTEEGRKIHIEIYPPYDR